MTIRRVISPDVVEPPPERWSNCLVVDGVAYVSGMTARGADPKALGAMDEYAQAKVIFGKIKSLVEAAGGAMSDVVKITIFLTEIANNTKVWQARSANSSPAISRPRPWSRSAPSPPPKSWSRSRRSPTSAKAGVRLARYRSE